MISISDLNPAVIRAQYAVRGPIALRAEQLREQLEKNPESKKQLGFDSIINCNIGNPQQLGQKPITFFRQVACLTEYPDLLNKPEAEKLFPKDVIKRAKSLLESIGSIGAYSHSKGVPIIRRHVADFIEKRDGFPADPDSIYLTAGASTGVSNLLQLLLSDPNDGVLIPIPQYPLYTAALALNKAKAVEYYLSEEEEWRPNIKELNKIIEKSKLEEIKIKVMVIISPGNPVGNCLNSEMMKLIVEFCFKNKIIIFADEVYQSNIFNLNQFPFISFKSIVKSMQDESISNQQALISFHSISKGQTGECGRRGGYFELVNIPNEIQEQIYKLSSIQLCPPLSGQIGLDLQVLPPQIGDDSFDLYTHEINQISNDLKFRSEKLTFAFNQLPGITCNQAQGALYLFPKIKLPINAFNHAKKNNLLVDEFYCLELLNQTGICIVPGSGFGQEPGTWHFRTTFLSPKVDEFIDRFTKFHLNFLKTYS